MSFSQFDSEPIFRLNVYESVQMAEMILLPVVSLISFQRALILPSLLVLRWVDKRERWGTLWGCVSFEVL